MFVADPLDYVAIDLTVNLVLAILCVASQFVSFVDIDCLKRKKEYIQKEGKEDVGFEVLLIIDQVESEFMAKKKKNEN